MCYSNVGNDDECWIGLVEGNNDSYWLDGNPSTYLNWGPDEPNNDNVPCVHIKNGTFYDIACNSTYRYICKGIYFISKVIFRQCSVWFSLTYRLS